MHSYFYVMYSFLYVYVLLLLCKFLFGYSASLCCSVYCFCVDVYCTTASGCQPNCSYEIYHIISYHIISYHIISYHSIPKHIISTITAFRRSTRPLSSRLNSLGVKINTLLSYEYLLPTLIYHFTQRDIPEDLILKKNSFIPNVTEFYTLLIIEYFTITNRNITFAL